MDGMRTREVLISHPPDRIYLSPIMAKSERSATLSTV